MIAFILGGSKSGKSALAEKLAHDLNQGTLYYLATMQSTDLEDNSRIENHIKNREPYGFETIEATRELTNILPQLSREDTVLLDSLTSWTSNEMFVGKDFFDHVCEDMMAQLLQLSESVQHLIIVSDIINHDSIQYDDYTDHFKKQLGLLNCEVATIADYVAECNFTQITIHKGKEFEPHETIQNRA